MDQNLSLDRYITPWGKIIDGYTRDGTSDKNTFISSVAEDEYQIAKLPEKGLAVDLGLHIGTVSLILASRGWDVIGVEMLPDNVDLANKNITLNNLPGTIRIYQKAITKEDGKKIKGYYSDTSREIGKVHQYIGTTIPRKLHDPHALADDGQEIIVETITLETIFKENDIKRCDFLKVDIEGAEWEIFENIPEEILDKIDRIAIELDGARDNPTSTEAFMKYLKGKFVDVSKEYFPKWCAPGTWVHGYYIRKGLNL